MNAHRQIFILVTLLVIAGVSMVTYKHKVLGFPLFASETQIVWKIESRLDFDALGGPVTARLYLPEPNDDISLLQATELTAGYQGKLKNEQGERYAEWTREDARPGPQSLFLIHDLFYRNLPVVSQDPPPQPIKPQLSEVTNVVLEDAAEVLREGQLTGEALVLTVLRELNNPASEYLGVLLRDMTRRSEKLQLAIDLLAMQGVPATLVRGVALEDRQSNRPPLFMLKVWEGDRWVLYDPREVTRSAWDRFIVFSEGSATPLFEVSGGENSRLSFSVVREQRAAFLTAVEETSNSSSVLVDFSIYSLPVAQQSTFKLLLLMPLGALIVVILRNLVGIRTSGTFMPILISLAFLQTGLLVGLVLFLMVVGTGLIARSYLTRLNLLLVPRIAAVLVIVIIIYGAIGIAGHKLGFEWGLSVTAFPMIILSWTIERMSILWDEEGGHEVMIQGGGSLLTASLAYLLMSNQQVADALFLYPEALLILLAIIIGIGSYSGYRLSDLRRFEPMERY